MYNADSFTVADPEGEPVTAADLQEYARVFETEDETLLEAMGVAARQSIEGHLNRLTISRSVTAYWKNWINPLRLPFAPIASITSVKYYDGDNTLQTLAATEYEVDLNHDPVEIGLAYGKTWPALYTRYDAVQVTYSAGYGSAGTDVPSSILIALKATCLSVYENRGIDNEAGDSRPWELANPSLARLINAYRRGFV